MRERERLLWSILIILLLIIAGYEGYNAYRLGKQMRNYQAALTSETLGSEDPQLRETVEQMESELQDRINYQFGVNRDPLDLSQVIHARRFLASLGFTETPESQGKMRLSCTVIAEQPAAVIKFQGRSQILRKGDTIDGYRITEIKPEHCVLVRGGDQLTLGCEKSPETMEELVGRREGEISVTASDSDADSDTLEPSMNF